MIIHELVYLACALMSIACAVLLLIRYRQLKSQLVLWCSICFVGLAANNILLFIDTVVFPEIEMPMLSLARNVVGLIGAGLLLNQLSRSSQ